MGQTASTLEPLYSLKNITDKKYFNIDRILIANFQGIDNNNVTVGVLGQKENKDNIGPFSNQGIRIGKNDIATLKFYEQNQTGLKYEFENDIQLKLYKKNDDIFYNLKTKEFDITNKIDPVIPKFYKNIGMQNCSDELDKINDLFNGKLN